MGFTETMSATVIRGMGYANVWESEHPQMLTKIAREMGWEVPPIPGTLNLLCEFDIEWSLVKKRPIPYGAGKPSFVVSGVVIVNDQEVPVAFVRQEVSTQAENLLEAMSSAHLQTKLSIGIGSPVLIQIELET